jgi:hypothetical protein
MDRLKPAIASPASFFNSEHRGLQNIIGWHVPKLAAKGVVVGVAIATPIAASSGRATPGSRHPLVLALRILGRFVTNPPWTRCVQMLCSRLFYSSISSAEAGDTRNNADGTNSSECGLRRDLRDDRACAQRLPFIVDRYCRQPIHVARSRSSAKHARDPTRPSATLLSGRPAARDAERGKGTGDLYCYTPERDRFKIRIWQSTSLGSTWGRRAVVRPNWPRAGVACAAAASNRNCR